MMSGATVTLSFAFGLGAIVSAISSRLRFPTVLPLLAAGVLAGPSGLGVVDVASVGGAFRALVALSIGLLVFEGGLHLDRWELRRAPRAVLGLLTIGVLVTWAGSAALAVLVLGMDVPMALLLGSLLIVTGPTVIQPILRHVRLTNSLHAALSAEAILIDPIGVVLSVVTMEVVAAYYGGAFEGALQHVVRGAVLPIGGGLLVGLVAGGVGSLVMRLISAADERKEHTGKLNIAATGICMLAIAVGEMVAPEGGLVATTIAAVIMANTHAVASSDVRKFKQQVATLLVGMLFILLASQIDVGRLRGLGATHVVFIAALLLLVRPINAWLGTARSSLSVRERGFLALFAPRGIVAASVATLTAARLSEVFGNSHDGVAESLVAQARSLDLIVYAVIGVSVLWATVSASPLGRVLGVLAGPPRGVMIVGAHLLGRRTARALAQERIPVVLVDANVRNCELAVQEGLNVVRADATDGERMAEIAREHEVGWVFAWTGNDDVDRVVVRWASGVVGPEMVRAGAPDLPTDLPEHMVPTAQSGDSAKLRALERLLHEGWIVVRVVPARAEIVPLLTLKGGRPVASWTPNSGNGHGNGNGAVALTLQAKQADEGSPNLESSAAG